MSGLGRRVPADFEHVERYPLSALEETPTKVPVVLGINWYSAFDHPVNLSGTSYSYGQRGEFWIARDGKLGSIRGGHAIACKPYEVGDGWWDYYNQGSTPACVGFSCARMMTLLNRKRYDALWLYKEAQRHDEWPGEYYEGTSVRGGCWVLKNEGPSKVLADGISAYRWTLDWNEVRATLGLPDSVDGVPLLNSWGRDYPHIVRLPDEVGQRLLDEDGEAAVVTDR